MKEMNTYNNKLIWFKNYLGIANIEEYSFAPGTEQPPSPKEKKKEKEKDKDKKKEDGKNLIFLFFFFFKKKK